MVHFDDQSVRIAAAVLDLAGEVGWRQVDLIAVSVRAGVSLAEIRQRFPLRLSLYAGILRLADRAMLEGGPADPAEPPRGRLFELLMRRFDALQAHRAGVLAALKELRRDPAASLCLAPHLDSAMRWALVAAGLPDSGPLHRLRIAGLAAVHLAVLRVWMRDESADMGQTMAALDSRLAQAERWAGWLDRRRGSPPAAAPPAGEAA